LHKLDPSLATFGRTTQELSSSLTHAFVMVLLVFSTHESQVCSRTTWRPSRYVASTPDSQNSYTQSQANLHKQTQKARIGDVRRLPVDSDPQGLEASPHLSATASDHVSCIGRRLLPRRWHIALQSKNKPHLCNVAESPVLEATSPWLTSGATGRP
jgi:hypothetical protein